MMPFNSEDPTPSFYRKGATSRCRMRKVSRSSSARTAIAMITLDCIAIQDSWPIPRTLNSKLSAVTDSPSSNRSLVKSARVPFRHSKVEDKSLLNKLFLRQPKRFKFG